MKLGNAKRQPHRSILQPVQWSTHSNAKLGSTSWGLGPSFVVLHLDKGSPWVYGVLVNKAPFATLVIPLGPRIATRGGN